MQVRHHILFRQWFLRLRGCFAGLCVRGASAADDSRPNIIFLLTQDPHEANNLAMDPALAARIEQFRQRLVQMRQQAK